VLNGNRLLAIGRETCQHKGKGIEREDTAVPINGAKNANGRVYDLFHGRHAATAPALTNDAIQIGADGIRRCPWGVSALECRSYHDKEWGRPVGSDERIVERLCLEGFQSDLSWLTIHRKRDGFRRAFAGFDPTAVAEFTNADVARLLADPAIVRHREKLLATIGNARATLRLRRRGISLAALLWSFEVPAGRPPMTVATVPTSTPESEACSRELRRHGFRFVGPTIVYAAMQSLGVVNDHLDGCRFRVICDDERRAFTRPR
jgi:DNA-3-methyladenine glycosylase I